jgi:branched-subunit amino acid ABC-type transport system permease component
VEVLEYAVRGIPIGCVYALLAVGLVLTFKTSGVFNLAFAAQAYVSAMVFYEVRKEQGWPLVPAAVLAILVVAPLVGVALDRFLYRYQRTSGSLAKLITSLGLLVAMPEIVRLLFGNESKKNPPALWWVKRTDQFLWPEGSRFVLDAGQIATLVSTAVVVVGLTIMFRRGGIGLQMRAVVESPRLVQLQGINAERVSLVAWVLSSILAGLAGVLIAPLSAQLDPLDFFALLVAAIAACVFGNLTSIVMTFVGGILLGVLQAELAGVLPTDSIVARGLRPSLPFAVLFVLVLVKQVARSSGDAPDPMAGVDPPPAPPAATLRPPWMTTGTRVFGVTVASIGMFVALFVVDDYWLSLITGGVALAVILLSVIVTTGIGGTISLCQGTFAAIGAFTTAQLVDRYDLSVLVAMVVGGLVAAAVGALLGFPIIRLAGIYPALATLAFALMFQSVIVPQEWISGGDTPVRVPRPLIGSIDMANDRPFLVLCVLFLALLGSAVILIRKGTTGRYLDALRGSEAAAASVGIHPYRTRLVAFVVGAGIAGFGGGLLASYNGQASYEQSFTFYFGLVWLVLVITAGFRSVQAAVMSGVTFFLFPQLLQRLFAWPGNYLASNPDVTGVPKAILDFVDPKWSLGVAFILFGFGALTYAKHPEGIIEAQTTKSIKKTLLRIDKARGGDLAAQEEAIDLELAGAGHSGAGAGAAGAGAGSGADGTDSDPSTPAPVAR